MTSELNLIAEPQCGILRQLFAGFFHQDWPRIAMPVMLVSMIPELQRKLLRQLFAGFFHQDWRIEADTPEGVVTHYATQMVDRAALPELSDAILAFIDDYPNDDELADALFRKLGCYYSPKALGQSTKEWLLHIAERVRAEDKARRST